MERSTGPGGVSVVLPPLKGGDTAAARDAVASLAEVREVVEGDAGPLPASLNGGVEAASGEWLLFVEAGCRFPSDYAAVLRRVAEREGARLVAGTCAGDGRREAEVTPFLSGGVLVHRDAFRRKHFDPHLSGPAEECDVAFFVAAMRDGYLGLLTPATSYERLPATGGARRFSLAAEYWALRNHWRFLRRHSAWLYQQGWQRQRSILAAQVAFAARRLRALLG